MNSLDSQNFMLQKLLLLVMTIADSKNLVAIGDIPSVFDSVIPYIVYLTETRSETTNPSHLDFDGTKLGLKVNQRGRY